MAESKVDIVRMKQDVVQGHQISENDVEVVKVGGYNLPADVIKKKENVVGRFATTDLKTGDYLLPSKLTNTSDKANDVFRTLNGDKQAISITIQTFAGGLSGKLQNGDIVQLVVYRNSTAKTFIPGALTYVKVITTTTAEGADKDELTVNEDGTYELPSTVTLLVNQAQAKLLVEYENSGRIHADLVYRGDEATAQKFLDAQDDYFKYLEEHPVTDQPGEETDADGEGFDIVKHANDIINGRVPAYIPGQEGDGNE
jgi:pilus assembly protein CpaB